MRSVSVIDVRVIGGVAQFPCLTHRPGPFEVEARDSVPSLIPCHLVAAFGLMVVVLGGTASSAGVLCGACFVNFLVSGVVTCAVLVLSHFTLNIEHLY